MEREMHGVGRWLAAGRTGASSSALAAATLGNIPNHAPAYPHDSDDFGRCYVLWGLTPEAKDGLARLAAISGPWKRLADRWDELLALYEHDRPACHKLIRSLVSQVSGIYETRKGEDGRWDSFPVREFSPPPPPSHNPT